MANELSPSKAAELALNVYSVNKSSDIDLKVFLKNPVFKPGIASKTVLKGKVGGRIIRAAEDAFGVCAMGAGKYEGDVFLVFRGTTTANNNADWVTDARIGLERSKSGLPVHIGFNHTFTSMLPEMQKFISQAGAIKTIHCIGHSLGGAVATLAADWVAKNNNVKLYTFGQPRVGLTFFSTMLTHKMGKGTDIHRTFHSTDPVPMVPVFPYVHNPFPGNGHRIISNNPITTAEAHDMDKYRRNASKVKDWKGITSAPPLFNHEEAIEEWLRSNINSNPMCPRTFEWLENALVWLLKKQLASLAVGFQWAAMGIHTFIDKVAWILSKGIEIGEKVGGYVKLFAKKLMKILGIKFQEGVTKLTHAFFRYLFQVLVKRANDLAMRAVRGISNMM